MVFLKRRGAEMCTFGVLGLSCASPGGPVWWDTQRGKRTNFAAGEGKKRAKFWAVRRRGGPARSVRGGGGPGEGGPGGWSGGWAKKGVAPKGGAPKGWDESGFGMRVVLG